ncbi:FadR/GntR family transcriptional regulator [Kineococcus radiotolerans]|uniref:GntR domain protein n=1 Tax=Kineococcus radiotolerans (strain ATCC BAA-149 / DSM 14245 / SRS30216) TaxID=266940 RepID=A6WGB9_KINRD|nr:FadR/GntR family transcriptional regulator [Kineococcus radiotolerans]ABS05858.1 GntR domain protein [Kineococcus radiotolerans SRS30216 = ATCC BAA-149]
MPPAPVSPHRGLLTERIARELEHEIRTGALAVGDKLPSERELSARFAASRGVVREVLRRLEAQHLIEVAAGRGSFVSSPGLAESRGFDAVYRASRPTVRQLIRARLPLEVESAGLAAELATEEDLATLAAAHRAVLEAPDAVAMARADLGFHEAIAVTSGNPVLRIMLLSIGPMMFEMMLRSNSDPSIAEPGVPHHAEILAAITAHDVELARENMREHLALGLRTYGPDLDEPLEVMANRHLEHLLQHPF